MRSLLEALEEALEANAEHPLVESLHFPVPSRILGGHEGELRAAQDELDRAEALQLDAEYYLGSNWQQERTSLLCSMS